MGQQRFCHAQEASIAAASQEPVCSLLAAVVSSSDLIRLISAGSPSPSVNNTPLVSIARASFRSGVPAYGLGADSAAGSAEVHRSARAMSVRAMRCSETASASDASE
jgi:hypothetical protein